MDNPERRPFTRCGSTSDGSKYMEYHIQTGWLQAYSEINHTQNLPFNIVEGNTYSLGFLFKFNRVGGIDIWHNDDQSEDKLIEFRGPGIRWIFYTGQFDRWCYPTANEAGRFSAWAGILTYRNNSTVECVDHFTQNASGYSGQNPIQLNYERWHTGVISSKLTRDYTGNATVYVDGVKIIDYQNIKTIDDSAPMPAFIEYVKLKGTIAQPRYDAPEHYSFFDKILLTDNWQDIVNGGYLRDPNDDTTLPTAPGSFTATVISSTQINLSWSASTDNVGVTGYRLERCTGTNCTTFAQISAPLGTAFSNTTLSSGTTYQYRVRAADSAGNLSSYSSIITATTPSAPTPAPTATQTPPPGSTVVTLTPAADTHLNLDTVNYSTQTELYTYTWPTNTSANTILMKFNLVSIPSIASISSALLNLTYTGSDPGDTDPVSTLYTISAHKVVNRNPNLSLATGYTYDGTNFWTGGSASVSTLGLQDIGPRITSVGVTKVLNTTYTWNLTSLVQDWVTNPTLNYGLLLNSDPTKGADRSRYFASLEHPIPGQRPVMTVTYTIPSGGDTVAPGVPTGVRVE